MTLYKVKPSSVVPAGIKEKENGIEERYENWGASANTESSAASKPSGPSARQSRMSETVGPERTRFWERTRPKEKG